MLTHRVSIVRDVPTGSLDAQRHETVAATTIASAVPAAIQPTSDRERAQQADAGVVASDFTVFLRHRSLTDQDRIVHVAASCPMAPDLPDATYLVRGIRDAAGLGHHLEVNVTTIATRAAVGS